MHSKLTTRACVNSAVTRLRGSLLEGKSCYEFVVPIASRANAYTIVTLVDQLRHSEPHEGLLVTVYTEIRKALGANRYVIFERVVGRDVLKPCERRVEGVVELATILSEHGNHDPSKPREASSHSECILRGACGDSSLNRVHTLEKNRKRLRTQEVITIAVNEASVKLEHIAAQPGP